MSRRNRLSLSLVRRSESPKSPIGDRTRSSISELNTSTDSRCSTPLNTRKRPSLYNDEDSSPIIPMSQDANVVTGVAWRWNSPKRPIANDKKPRSKPLTNRNVISNKDPEFGRAQRKKTVEKLTGFYKFQSELQLLAECDESKNAELEQKESCSSLQVCPPTSPPPSPDENIFMSVSLLKSTKDSTTPVKKRRNTHSPFFKRAEEIQSDSFNDSELDNLLLQASQAVESKSEHPKTDKSVPAQEKQPEKRRSFFKSRTSDNLESIFNDDTLSDLDFFLVEASQQLEVDAAPSSSATLANASGTKKGGILTRHKSMPESPSQKMSVASQYRTGSSKWTGDNLPQPPISIRSDSSDASVVVIPPPKNDVISVSSSDSCTSIASHISTAPAQQLSVARKCTPQEIEEKRQEALKRQASRLKRLMQGNHSQGDATGLFKSKKP